ncbi:MAG: hypothetical protein L0099_10540 [Acidobacteria bacterium]|nr:hypothetical protein [Acidobacteriota bacterium]
MKRPSRKTLAVIFLLLLAAGATFALRDHVRALGLLLRLTDPQASLARLGASELETAPFSIASDGGPVPGRIYRPRGVENPPGLVLVHGVHRLGPDDPRLVRLAQAFAATGLVVLTPQVASFSDYRLEPEAIATIGAAASSLRRELGSPVGVVAISFAGGLALVAATDPRFASDIAFVVALGAHHDLERVSIFFATDRIQLPDRRMQEHESDQYGALVLIYADVESFFERPDQAAAREAIRLWLGEQWEAARAVSRTLSPAAHARLEALFRHEREGVRDRLVSEIHRHAAELLKVSPRGKLGALRVPVFFIHGVGDKVIPTSETEWLAREVPPEHLRWALITPVLSHADLKAEPGVREYWEVVRFMRDVLVEAERAAAASQGG